VKVSSFSIILAFICLFLIGSALIPMLTVKLSPSQSLPQISISFTMYGSSPRTVEIEATSKLEAMFSRMRGIEKISSISGNEWGRINIEFDKHTDMDIARFEVSTIVRQLWKLLPENISYPSISQNRVDQNANKAFLSFTVNATASPQEIQDFAKNVLRPQLSSIEGVNKIEVSGATPMAWEVEYDANLMDLYGIRIQDIQDAIANSLKESFLDMAFYKSLGQGKEWIRTILRTSGDNEKKPLTGITVKRIDGTMIPIEKISKISRIESQPQSYYRVNGLNSIYLSVMANENSNQLGLSEKIKQKLFGMQNSLPKGFEIHTSYDATEYIKAELDKIYFRTGLTLVILLAFILIIYRNLKYILLVVLSLGCNLAVAAIGYYLLKLEIQLYSLVGITISLTLVLDNIIVMADHIINRKNKKSFTAILGATITTIGTMSIIFFLDEKLRLSLQDFAAVVIINLVISLLIILFLVPALMDRLEILSERQTAKNKLIGRRLNRLRFIFTYFVQPYALICRFLQRWRVCVIILIVFTFGLPVFLIPEKVEGDSKFAQFYNKSLGTPNYKENVKPYINNLLGGTLRLFVQKVYNGSYLAEPEETSLNISASLSSNSTLKEMNKLIQQMESYLSQFPQIKQFQTNVYNSRQASIDIQFTKEHAKSSFPHLLKNKLITKSLELGGGSWGVYGVGDGFSNEVRESAGSYQVEIYGFNYDELSAWAEKFKQKLLRHKRINNVNIDSEFSWFKDDYEEFHLDIAKEKLAEEGIQPYQLYDQLSLVFGREINSGYLSTSKGSEKVYLSSKQSNDYDIWNLLHTPVKINGRAYKLSELAQITKGHQPKEIGKVNQQYRLCLQYEYIGANEQGRKVLDNYIEDFKKTLPIGYSIKNSNSYFRWNDENQQQYWLLLLVFIITYFITSILFNSTKQSLYIILVIPVSFIGVFLTFYLFTVNFDQGGFASFILLSSLTVNANIYFINEYNNIRKKWKHLTPMKAYLQAWNAKARPVLLTALSTTLGFIPFLIDETKEAFWFPLAIGTIGGLIASTFATFFFLPLLMGIGKKPPVLNNKTQELNYLTHNENESNNF
jgi:multidrug efflux pump subunit AcrB